jgi:uncharacterized coiled-coil protein SlyX
VDRATLAALDPADLARMCEERGARVVLENQTYRIYPPDPAQRPVFFSALRQRKGASLDDQVRNLRRSGLDLTQPLPEKQAPKTGTETKSTETKDDDTVGNTMNGVISPAMRKELDDTRGMVRNLSDTTVQMLADAEDRVTELRVKLAGAEETILRLSATVESQGRSIAHLARSVSALQAGAAEPPRVRTAIEVTMDAVLAFLTEHAGLKLSPVALLSNIDEDRLPERASAQTIGMACRRLVEEGRIRGGAPRNKINTTGTGNRSSWGVYWVEKPAPGDADATTEPANAG